ncbi:hypothetical protein pb186bvf_013882 [Paramecium bursaria]
MLIILLLSLTYANFPIKQDGSKDIYGFGFALSFNNVNLILDLQKQFTSANISGSSILCNHTYFNYNCSQCLEDICYFNDTNYDHYFPLNIKNGSLTDIYGVNQDNQIIYAYENSSRSFLGLGAFRQTSLNPSFPLINDQFTLCYGNSRGFYSKDSYNTNYKIITYENNYEIKISILDVGILGNVNLTGIKATFDSITPYIGLPETQFNQFSDIIKKLGFYNLQDNEENLISDSQINELLINLPVLKFHVGAEIVEVTPKNYLYIGPRDKALLGIKSKKEGSDIELGQPFFRQKLMTITSQTIKLADYDCQGSSNSQSIGIWPFVLVLGVVIIGIIIFCEIRSKKIQKKQQLPSQDDKPKSKVISELAHIQLKNDDS